MYKRCISIAIACGALVTCARADWLTDANANIAKYRQGNLTVKVVDQTGKAVTGASVAVHETKSAFIWGTAVSSDYFSATSTNADKVNYRNAIRQYFNGAELENGDKWLQWENPTQQKASLATTHWLIDNGLRMRGHTTIWQKWDHTPADMTASSSAAYIAQRTNAHITDIVSANKGLMSDWDVVNELPSNHVYQDIINPNATSVATNPALVQWFNTAHAADPNAALYMNDYGILETPGQNNSSRTQSMIQSVQYLQSQNAPVGGVGLQAHFTGTSRNSMSNIMTTLNRFTSLGVPVQITEFDMTGDGWTDSTNASLSVETVKANYMRDFMTAVMGSPNVTGFQMWGFWDGQHFADDAPLFNLDWSLKESGQVYVDLLKQWSTNQTALTDAAGQLALRAYLGDYSIDVTSGGVTKTYALSLGPDGKTLLVTVPEPALGFTALCAVMVSLRRRKVRD